MACWNGRGVRRGELLLETLSGGFRESWKGGHIVERSVAHSLNAAERLDQLPSLDRSDTGNRQ